MDILVYCLFFATLGCAWSQKLEEVEENAIPEIEDLLPKILTKKSVIRAVEADNVTLPCEVERLEKHSVIWKKEDTVLWALQGQPVRIQYVVKDWRIRRYNTSLVIHAVTVQDEGLYSCEISIKPQEKVLLQLIISVPPTAEAKGGIDFVQDQQGTQVELLCRVDGKPRPNVTWEREDGKTMNGIPNDTSYIIKSLQPEDTGDYSCVASNRVGEDARAVINLNVQYAPYVKSVHNVVHTGINYDATLYCTVRGYPIPKVVWLKEEAPVNPMRLNKGLEKGNKYSLVFSNVIREDFGMYSCNASNFYGNASATMELTGRPLAPQVNSPREGGLPDQYTLSWEVKSYSSVIYYDVFFRNVSEGEESWVNLTIPGSSGSSMYHSKRYILRDLRPGFPLETKVRAINEFGTSIWSDIFQFKTFDPGEIFTTLTPEEDLILIEETSVPQLKLNDVEGLLSNYEPQESNHSNPFSVIGNFSASALASSAVTECWSKVQMIVLVAFLIR